MKDGFIRVAAATPEVRVADCAWNAEQIIARAQEAARAGAAVCVCPELCITGYTCGDLFLQDTLLSAAQVALEQILQETSDLPMLLAVGLPHRYRGALYNVAAILYHGRILGLVPKQHIPNYSEFYELRHFTSGIGMQTQTVSIAGMEAPMGTNMLFCCEEQQDFILGAEICEDLWITQPPSGRLAEAGATIIINLSASDEVIGKADYRRELVRSQSARLICGYIYADAGQGESTQDLVFSGHNLIAENGALLRESVRWETGMIFSEIDLGRLVHDRCRMNTFSTGRTGMTCVPFSMPTRHTELTRVFPMTPFVPTNQTDLENRCQEILTMQASGLAKRLKHTQSSQAVIGLSGGLDSTLALIVAVHAFDRLKLDRKGIVAITMPCFGTTTRTKSNAEKLAEAYGVTLQVVDIKDAVDQHFADIGHEKENLNVVFENGQARMRTLVLMDMANAVGGMVVGTGDLSELALGWATYNGDHMSMYGVNTSIPKTLVRYLTAFEASRAEDGLREILLDVLGTPVSPELLPPKDGEIAQKTEELVGPYELHDFFLYYMLRWGYPPRKIYRCALLAFSEVYNKATIKKWIITFLRRFFSQQFKRSCLPDGPKVGTLTLSPRGDWRMPSDAVSVLWLAEAERL